MTGKMSGYEQESESMETVIERLRVPAGYKLIKHIGSGRTAEVFHAVNDQGLSVALKLPKPEVIDDAALAKMFANEVMLYRSLDNPMIASFYSGQPTGPHPHLVMRYFPEGDMTVADLSYRQGLRVLLDVAVALEYLHGRRIVHQDIKPANIFMAEQRGFLADFGGAANELQEGQIAGSPFYMPPELYSGLKGTLKADIYSLGVVAYELLTGVRPFVGETQEALIAAHLAKVPKPVRGYNNDLPRELASIIDRSLAKDPIQRPTIQDWKLRLAEALASTTQPTPQPENSMHVTQVVETPPVAQDQFAPRRMEKSAARAKEKGFLERMFGKKK